MCGNVWGNQAVKGREVGKILLCLYKRDILFWIQLTTLLKSDECMKQVLSVIPFRYCLLCLGSDSQECQEKKALLQNLRSFNWRYQGMNIWVSTCETQRVKAHSMASYLISWGWKPFPSGDPVSSHSYKKGNNWHIIIDLKWGSKAMLFDTITT